MVTRVLIENLAPNRTVSDINGILKSFEPVAWIFIELDASIGQPWGYAYFALSSDEQAKAVVAASLTQILDKGNDGHPIRLRRVDSGPDNYIDKSPLLNSPAEYIFSRSSLIINNVPAGSSLLLDDVVKTTVDVSSTVEIRDLIPGKYKLSIKASNQIVFQQPIDILALKATEITVNIQKNDTGPVPFKELFREEQKPRSKRGVLVTAFLVLIILSLGAFYYLYSNPESSNNGVAKKAPPPPPGMVYIPAQRFVMGRNSSKDPLGFEMPAHATEVRQDFFLDRTEVTNKQYAEFVAATKHQPPPHWKGETPPQEIVNLPVVFVSWQDAVDYCQWRSDKKLPCRLPQEDEWELAARGSDSYIYPWGNDWKDGLANANKASNRLLPVGFNPNNASPFGALDMVGNVWEWVNNDLVLYELSKAPPQPGVKVIRGGAFDSDPEEATGSYRGFLIPNKREYDRTGFRCACDVVKDQK